MNKWIRQAVLGGSSMTNMQLWVLPLLLIFGSGACFAQSTNSGDIRGTVTDSTGALVPGSDGHGVECRYGRIEGFHHQSGRSVRHVLDRDRQLHGHLHQGRFRETGARPHHPAGRFHHGQRPIEGRLGRTAGGGHRGRAAADRPRRATRAPVLSDKVMGRIAPGGTGLGKLHDPASRCDKHAQFRA